MKIQIRNPKVTSASDGANEIARSHVTRHASPSPRVHARRNDAGRHHHRHPRGAGHSRKSPAAANRRASPRRTPTFTAASNPRSTPYEVDNGFYPKSLQDLIQQPSNARNWHGPYLDASCRWIRGAILTFIIIPANTTPAATTCCRSAPTARKEPTMTLSTGQNE